jgi:hypothetical protein
MAPSFELSEIATILTIIATLFTILLGLLRLIKWGQKRKKKKLTEPPQPLIRVIAPEAIKARQFYDNTLQGRARSLINQEKTTLMDESLTKLLNAESLTDPTVQLPSDSHFIDCICTVVARGGQTILMMPSGESQPDIEGVGRTSVLLRLLGLAVNAGRFIGLQLEDIHFLNEIPITVKSTSWCKLIATDMAYIGCSGKKLSVVPTKGEPVSFLWDLARHTFRITELGYKTGDHRKEPGRQKLIEIFNKIQFMPNNSFFGNLETLYPVDEVILLRREIKAEPSPPERRELKGEERIQQLRKALLVSTQHGSPFWRRNKQRLEKYVDYIIQNLDPTQIPLVSEICFAYPSPAIPNHYFDEIVEIIKTKRNPPKPSPSEMIPVRGIALHNYLLARSFFEVDEVRLLVTSGEKMFEDKIFWDSLFKVRRPMVLKILMLNPESPSTKVREKEAYMDKPEGFLAKEIRENIETLKRMCEYFVKVRKPVHMICSLYDELPSFRMTFIGDQKLLVTSYEKGKRTGHETIFYEISPQVQALFDGFNQEYQRIEACSKTIIKS